MKGKPTATEALAALRFFHWEVSFGPGVHYSREDITVYTAEQIADAIEAELRAPRFSPEERKAGRVMIGYFDWVWTHITDQEERLHVADAVAMIRTMLEEK